ncbi:MAG: hypothetical protein KAT05_02040, partial [Spirochaetes bacterium]|nr:hypothetical protein [Spirochaetota bacterium]
MNSRIFELLFLFVIIILYSCNNLDLGGLFVSSYVDQRFKEKNSLKDYDAPDVSDDNSFNFLVIADMHYDDSQPYYFKTIENYK